MLNWYANDQSTDLLYFATEMRENLNQNKLKTYKS